MNNADLIREFGRKIGLPDLRFSKEGTLALTVGEDLEIVLEEGDNGDGFDVYGIVGPLPSTSNRFLTELLKANHGCTATGGSALAIDPLTSSLTLCRRIAMEGATGDSLAREMEQFAKHLAFWTDYAPGLAMEPPDGPPVRFDEDMLGMPHA